MQALECWACIAGDYEVVVFMSQQWPKCWLAEMCADHFWADKRNQEAANTIAYSIWIKTVRPLHNIINGSYFPVVVDTSIPPKEVAVQ